MITGLDNFVKGAQTQLQLDEYTYLVEMYPNIEKILDRLFANEVYGHLSEAKSNYEKLMKFIGIDQLIQFEEFLFDNQHKMYLEGWLDEDITKDDMIAFFGFKELELCIQNDYPSISAGLEVFDLNSF